MRLHALLLLRLALLTPAALAPNVVLAAAALAQLPEATVQSLRSSLSPTSSSGLEALQRRLEELQTELRPATSGGSTAQQPAQAPGSARALRPASAAISQAQGHRAALGPLRGQVMAEIEALYQVAGEASRAAPSSALASLRMQVQARFDRLDAALLAVETARGEAAVADAQRALAALVLSLQAPTPVQPAAPVPTLAPLRPLLRAPGSAPASTTLPRYASDSLSGGATRSAALRPDAPTGFGYVKASATLPPVAADTATDCSAVAADLADDGVEVQLTPEIRALAQELHYSPVRMLRWMQTEVRFEPYWGSLKGAVGVLQTRSGNATDQASLLVALLRSANTPARFVRGTVALLDQAPSDSPSSVVQRWLGTKNYSGSLAYLNSGGVPAGTYSLNGAVHGLVFDHVWVQACVPFAAYRGTLADAGGYRWLAMDAAVKDHDYQAGLNLGLALDTGFYAPYLAGRTLQLPPDYLAERIEAAARAVKSDASAEDVLYRGRPRALRLDVLPGAPPFAISQFSNWPGSSLPETAILPEAHRHRFAVTVRSGAGAVLATAAVALPQKAFGKITVSYAPDAASQALWNSWGGTLAALPAGSVKVYPRIQVDGVTLASGPVASAMPLGTVHSVVMKLSQGEELDGRCIADSGNPSDPRDGDVSCLNKTVYGNVKAGAYYALGFNAGQTSDALLAGRARRLAEQVNIYPSAPTPASGAGYDATVGELLHIVLQSYIHETERADRRIAELKGLRSTGGYDIGLTGAELRTEYVFDLPLSVKPAGVYVDFKGGIYGFSRLDSAAPLSALAGESNAAFNARRRTVLNAEQVELAKLSIYAGSALEHHVWQQALRTDAVSTVRGLQFAAESGVSLVEFTSANIGQYDSLMQMSGPTSMAGYKAGIQAEVAAGAVVTVPRAQIAYTDPVDPAKAWRGAVYMSANAASGAYGAIINGSISGGFPLLNSTPVRNVYAGNPNAPSFVDLSNAGTGRLSTLPTGQQGSNSLASWAGDPVNMLTGTFTHNESDLRIKGRGGLPIVFERWYNSGAPKDGPLGFGWTHSFNHQLRLYGVENGVAKVGWVNGSGGESFFSSASHSGGDITRGSTLANSPGVQLQFTRIAGGADDGKFQIRERHGLSYLFASASGPGGAPTPSNTVTARLLAITDRNGNQLSLGYNGSNQLDKVSDSLGRTVLTLGWTGSRITQLSDLSGRKLSYAYTDGLLTQVTDPLNQLRGYSYYGAADGPQRERRIKRLTLPRGNGIEFEYYSGGQVFRHTPLDTEGQPIPESALTFHYNPFARESWTVNGRGHRHLFAFDAHGNPLRIEDGAGAERHYSYDPAKPFNRLSETDSVGRSTRYSYNAQDLLETQTLPSGAVLEYRDYNAFAQPQRIKNARGHWSLLRYDARGNLTDSYSLRAGVVPAAGSQPATADLLAWTRRSYDSAGNLVTTLRVKDFSAITGPSLTQTWSPDKLNLLSLTRAGNRNGSQVSETSPSFSYDSLGRLKSGVDARWYPSAFSYDALDRLSQASDSLGKTRSFRFDANGNLIGSELVDGGRRIDSQALAYDAQDRVERSLDHAGNLSQNAYDEIGQLIARTSADQDRIGVEYDAAGHAVAAFDAEGNRVHSQLDTQGRPLIVTDPNGHQTRYEYWGASSFDGRLRRVSLPAIPGQAAGRAEEYEYDAAGQVTRSRSIAADGSSRRERFNFFDELGRPVRSVGAADDAGQRLQVCTKFDTLSRPIEVWAGPTTDTTRTSCDFADALLKRQQTQAWDDFGQLLSKTDALGRLWRYGYDEHGNLASSQSPEQAKLGPTNKTVYAYDPQLNGLLRSRTVPGAGNAGQSLLYKRNALGQVERVETRDG
ncbi:DUF6531 domain-containing protein, partial [Paucibacter sp. XJ19-41]|uniref:DUF6531 domain-containing protein n=1 Tax=Paucibacter sp. XJ19-41 TaxID=2927824 RepID=UPI002349C903